MKYNQEYYQRNKELIKRRSSEWRKTFKGKLYFQKYYQQNKTHKQEIQQAYHTKVKIAVLEHYGNGECACVECGEKRLACLSIDHLNGGGNKHRKENTGYGNNFYLWLKRHSYPSGYQTLCMNCQYVKREEKKECKHYAISQTPMFQEPKAVSTGSERMASPK